MWFPHPSQWLWTKELSSRKQYNFSSNHGLTLLTLALLKILFYCITYIHKFCLILLLLLHMPPQRCSAYWKSLSINWLLLLSLDEHIYLVVHYHFLIHVIICKLFLQLHVTDKNIASWLCINLYQVFAVFCFCLPDYFLNSLIISQMFGKRCKIS